MQGMDQRREITATDFWAYVDNGQVTGELVITPERIKGENPPGVAGLEADSPKKFFVIFPEGARGEGFLADLDKRLAGREYPAKVRLERTSWWRAMLPHVLLMMVVFLAVWFLVFRRMGQASGAGFLGSFGRSRHRVTNKEQSKITFKDVAGIDEAKDEVLEIIEFLRHPRKFQRLGGRIPRGVLLVGEPGCGKTLLAKAIAGEADVPVFSISGSDFVEMFVGVGASRVRDLFKQARDAAPCIIFLDEIDAVGRRRGAGFGTGGADEREQTLNAILVEMDGLGTNDQVIIIAATNRTDVLDPALTRPGRFDRNINVPLPDLKGRYDILKIYAAKIECGADVDLHRLARGTPMFSGADLEALVNEAAIAATMADKESVEQEDLEEARDKVRWGRARRSRVIDEQEKSMTAYHEAGHALVQVLTPEADPLHKVSIIPRGSMGGATFALPEKDRYLYTKVYCQAQLTISLGGRVAEELVFGDVSSGASNDILHVTGLARTMVVDWGMSEQLGLISYNEQQRHPQMMDLGGKDYSDKTAELIDSEIKRIVDEAHQRARKVLEAHRDELERIAQALLAYETLNAEEVKLIIDGKTLDKTSVNDLIDIEHAKTAEPGEADAPPTPAEDGQTDLGGVQPQSG
ncbi:MAG TPA: ATP-dependent metallopeptidase FtsH/Yme1/Tma family protein [Phycisphaerae bacterium]|nr:ATP-dependent metallopeptidase FtsH/Yme1/Tma family protein [Phycisphaerae bacterium]HDZ43107.1 ATP-dependent metallopeptidase FtsH/Yme1/Tma family protein [Phycisphaerae bacterium]